MVQRRPPVHVERLRHARRRSNAEAQAASAGDGPIRRTLPVGVLLLVLSWLVIAFQPISSSALWWDLSRGRAVFAGSWHPSATLLALEQQAEADWLGGTLGYAAYTAGGATGLMGLRVAAVTALVVAAAAHWRRRYGDWSRWPAASVGIFCFALLGVSPLLDPLSALPDLVGVVAVLWWVERKAGQPSWRAIAALAAIFLVWANFGARPLVGLLLVAVCAVTPAPAGQAPRRSRRLWPLVASLAAGSLTPRGVGTWADSALLVFPVLSTPPAATAGTPWQPLVDAPWGLSEAIFAGLTLGWLIQVSFDARRRSARHLAIFMVLQACAWCSAANVPLAIAGLACQMILSAGGLGLGQSSVSVAERAPRFDSPTGTAGRAAGWIVPPALIASFWIAGIGSTMGFGISTRLDPRFMQLAFSGVDLRGTALADDIRSAGMLAWMVPAAGSDPTDRPIQLQDVPQRALLGGRLVGRQQLLNDLRGNRISSYWREDGTQGGWWLPLRARETSLLCVSNEATELIHGLEPTIWKPLSLDSPVLPYAAAGDPAYAEKTVEVLRFRNLVEWERWSYSLPRSTGSEYDRDRWGLRGEVGRADAALRQAQVFRAMGLRHAALRVLHVARRHWPENADLDAEFRRCQLELADLEQRDTGQASWLRRLAAEAPEHWPPKATARENAPLNPCGQVPERSAADGFPPAPPTGLLRALRVYLDDGPEAALAAVDDPHPQSRYAALCWAREAGLREEVLAIGRALLEEKELDASLRLMVQHRLRDLDPERQDESS